MTSILMFTLRVPISLFTELILNGKSSLSALLKPSWPQIFATYIIRSKSTAELFAQKCEGIMTFTNHAISNTVHFAAVVIIRHCTGIVMIT